MMDFNFISQRKSFYSLGIFTTFVAILAVIFLPKNLGIDLTGGVQAEFSFSNTIDVKQIETIANEQKQALRFEGQEIVNNVTAYKIAGENKFIIEAGINFSKKIPDKKLDEFKTQFKNNLSSSLGKIPGENIKLMKYVNIGESFGKYIRDTAYLTIIITILAISLYLAWAFRGSIEGFSSYPFAFVTIITLLHDVLVALGFYLITSFFFPEFKLDTFFITAMLTVLGYSISDTIVILDRIRSNLKQKINKKLDFGVLINNSINETLKRSIYTSFTVFLTLVIMFFFGPVTIKGFILAMIYGTIFGTYSSIAIAAPMLYDFSNKK